MLQASRGDFQAAANDFKDSIDRCKEKKQTAVTITKSPLKESPIESTKASLENKRTAMGDLVGINN